MRDDLPVLVVRSGLRSELLRSVLGAHRSPPLSAVRFRFEDDEEVHTAVPYTVVEDRDGQDVTAQVHLRDADTYVKDGIEYHRDDDSGLFVAAVDHDRGMAVLGVRTRWGRDATDERYARLEDLIRAHDPGNKENLVPQTRQQRRRIPGRSAERAMVEQMRTLEL